MPKAAFRRLNGFEVDSSAEAVVVTFDIHSVFVKLRFAKLRQQRRIRCWRVHFSVIVLDDSGELALRQPQN